MLLGLCLLYSIDRNNLRQNLWPFLLFQMDMNNNYFTIIAHLGWICCFFFFLFITSNTTPTTLVKVRVIILFSFAVYIFSSSQEMNLGPHPLCQSFSMSYHNLFAVVSSP